MVRCANSQVVFRNYLLSLWEHVDEIFCIEFGIINSSLEKDSTRSDDTTKVDFDGEIEQPLSNTFTWFVIVRKCHLQM